MNWVLQKYLCWSFLLAWVMNPMEAQNMLPDGGFEVQLDDNCLEPEERIQHMTFWYPLGSTPDVIQGNCPIINEVNIFWTPELDPFEGQNYAGIACRVNSNQTYISEGLATQLKEPLEAGRMYSFEMQIRNKGFYQGFPSSVITCPLRPEKHIDLYLDTDSIEVVNDFSNGTATTNSRLGTEIYAVAIQDEPEDAFAWSSVSTCFVAEGGETHLGVLMPLGSFGAFPACSEDDMSGTFYSFYYDLDNLSLQPMPAALSGEVVFQQGAIQEVNLREIFDFPLKEQAVFLWEDGLETDTRIVQDSGTFQLEAILACGSLDLELSISVEAVNSELFIPNAFSPNGDGINDTLDLFGEMINTVENFQFLVFDRWGNQVFLSTSPLETWDGTYKNEFLPTGIYIWFLEYDKPKSTGIKRELLKGEVVLIR